MTHQLFGWHDLSLALMLLIRPLARLAPGLRGFTSAPVGLRLVMTGVAAAALTAAAASLIP